MDVNSATAVATGRLKTSALSHGFLCKILMKTVCRCALYITASVVCLVHYNECAVPCTLQ